MFLKKLNNKRLTLNILIVSLLLIVFLQWHNINSYPVLKRGFDAPGHREYVSYLKINRKIPLANEGWELWQPPLYYLFGSVFRNITDIKLLNFSSWILLALSSYYFFNKLFNKKEAALTGAFLVSSLPVVLYQTPQISNEFFSAVLISLTIIYYLIYFKKPGLKEKVILGVLLGLSILSKATAFILIAAIFIDQLAKNKFNPLSTISNFLTTIFTVTVIGGWYYLRNIYYFKTPFIASYDFPKFSFKDLPFPRDLEFFTDFSAFFKFDLFYAHHYSFWPGTFFSWFYDGHNAVIPVQEFSKAGNMLVILSIPIFLFSIVGFFTELKKINDKNRLLLIYPVLLFISYVMYNFKLPYYGTVKATLLISSIIPWGFFTLKGILYLKTFKLYELYKLFPLYLFIYCLLLIKNFWILPNWY